LNPSGTRTWILFGTEIIFGVLQQFLKQGQTGVIIGSYQKLRLIGIGYNITTMDLNDKRNQNWFNNTRPCKLPERGLALVCKIGYRTPKIISVPKRIQVRVPDGFKNQVLVIFGLYDPEVRNFASSVRAIKPPEPYKGKGIRYDGESINFKVGKTGKKLK
jgi:ribosomal protein L6P/L9E